MKVGHALVGFRCDGLEGTEPCTHNFDSQQFLFAKALAALKAAGWAVRKEGDQWKHYCGRCWTLMQLGLPAPIDQKGNG